MGVYVRKLRQVLPGRILLVYGLICTQIKASSAWKDYICSRRIYTQVEEIPAALLLFITP